MNKRSSDCLGNYNFNHIAYFAKKRFIDGYSTMTLLQHAKSELEREEIVLVCMLDIEDDVIINTQLQCKYASRCRISNCRDKIRKLIDIELKKTKTTPS